MDAAPTPLNVTIRAERADDAEAIARVVEAAFGSPTEAALVAAIRASDQYEPELALVAVHDRTVVGHVMVSRTWLDGEDRRREIPHLSPLAVDPRVHGRGVGSALVRAVLARADERGLPLVALEGDPGYYGRLGFEPSAPLGIHLTLPSWAPPEAAQLVRLRAYDPMLRGRIVYPPAFASVTEH